MSPLSKAILLSLLVWLLHSQARTTGSSQYTLNGQTYSYIFG